MSIFNKLQVNGSGLNTLVVDVITSSTNTIGYPNNSEVIHTYRLPTFGAEDVFLGFVDAQATGSQYINADLYFIHPFGVQIGTGLGGTHAGSYTSHDLVMLNIHRNGLYGHNTFKQIRSHQNPLTRYHNRNSIFSYVSEVGDIKQAFKGSQLLSTHRDRRGQLFQITESPIISSNRPLMVVGSVQTDSEDPSELDRVEILTSFGNENQYFGNEQANRHHNLIYDVVEGYEDLTDLYLDGGLDSDDSPFDQFELLRYSHMIYPKAGNTYLGEVRSRENFISGYWKDLRSNRNETGTIDNGFGFTIPSQSIWPLDAEDNWATRALGATVGSFTASIPCDFAFNSASGSAGGFEFGAADISFFAASAEGPVGIDTTFTTNTVDGVVGYEIAAEKYSISSKQGTTNFWNTWSDALQAGNFRVGTFTATYVTRSAYTAPTNFGSSEPFYLQIHPTAFVASNWKNEFDNMHLHFWGKDLTENSTTGFVYREVDSSGGNRRSIKIDEGVLITDLSTEYLNTFEDGTTSTYIGSSSINGGVQFRLNLVNNYASSLGRYWNNYIVETRIRDAISSNENFSVHLNGTAKGVLDGSVSLRDFYGFYTEGNSAQTIIASTAQGKDTNDSFTNGSGPYNLPLGTTDMLITFFLKVVGSTTQTIFKFYTNTSNFIAGTISGGVLTISIFSTSSGSLKTRVSTFDISDHIGTLTKYIIFDNSAAGFYTALKLYAYTSNGLVEISGGETVAPSSTTRANLPSSLQQYSLYSIDEDASGGGQILADFALITGSFADADLNLLANSGSTIDLTSSYWTGPAPVAWWRLGNGSSDPANYDGSNASKKILHDYATHAAGPFHITASAGFTTTANSGPPRNLLAGANYYTSSVSEVFLLCSTSSTNNLASDYFQNGEIAEIALFTGSAAFDESKYAVTPKYCFVDLTSSAVAPSPTASIWYAFSGSDSIAAGGASVSSLAAASAFSAYKLTGSYTGATKLGTRAEGLMTSGSANFTFRANQPLQGQGTNQALPGAGIQNFVSSSVLGDDALDTFFLGAEFNASGSPGILQNSYNSFNAALLNTAANLDDQLYAGPSYTRRHSLSAFNSIGHPFGINPQIGAQRNLLDFELFQGTAFWDAPEQSSRNPFYDTYAKYSENMRLFAQDYSIVPEFRISNHIDKFLKDSALDFLSTDTPLLEITGGKSGATTSDTAEFFEVYSTTDFLKNFEIVQDDHKDFVDPLSITLRCKAIKKLLPYEGFYPAQRTVDIAKQFYNSYGSNLTLSSSFADGTSADYAAQYLLQPLFSPGILFNTIKSGVACDYPIMTGSFATSSIPVGATASGSFYINEQFHQRIPFEAIVEPEKFLANLPLGSQEPDPRGRADANVIWNGQGDEKYRLMVSNFLAEVGDFYLNNSDYTTIASLPQGDPNFGNAESGKTYMMRVRMYRSIEGRKDVWTTDSSKTYYAPSPTDRFGLPQDTGSMSQTITMYSRPSGFGPPQRLFLSGAAGDSLSVKFNNWSAFKKTGSIDTFYTRNDSVTITAHSNPTVPADGSTFADLQIDSGGHYLIGNDASQGYNYPFTPPYYHGEGWADIIFKPTETKKYTLQEIINQSSVEFLRYYEPMEDHGNNGTFTSQRLINEDAMQIASSMNIFSKGILSQDFKSDSPTDSYRWIIQSKFETPVLNFNKYNYTGSTNRITVPNVAPEVTPIGMWHQYGEIPTDPSQGIFVQVTDVPFQWIKNSMGGNAFLTSSLADLCGFSSNPVRVGELKQSKVIKEAVVAVPFTEVNGQREFFKLPKRDIKNALSNDKRELAGQTIVDMVEKMQEFVFPPSMDFINNEDIDPFSMYIFKFEHTLTKQDLANIWQNVSPDVALSNEETEATISHELLFHELLGDGAKLKVSKGAPTRGGLELDRQAKYDEIDPEVRWLVFKVKQRGSSNYFEKIFERNESNISKLSKVTVDSTGGKSTAQYNWPYDFFSLVELVKIDAEVDFAEPDLETNQERLKIKPVIKQPDRKVKKLGNKKNRKPSIKNKKPRDLKKSRRRGR